MYNANDAFAIHYATLLEANKTHANSNDFIVRADARDVMAKAESKLNFAKRHITFDVRIAAQTAQALKMQNAA